MSELKEWYTPTDFADLIGRHRANVNRAIASGKIPESKIRRSGRKIKIHITASEDYNNNNVINKNFPKIKEIVREEDIRSETPIKRAKLPDYTESKQIFEAYRARLAQLEYNERSGKMVDKEQTINAYATVWSGVRSSLRGLAGRAAIQLEGKTAHEIEHQLLESIEEIFEGIRNWTPNHFM